MILYKHQFLLIFSFLSIPIELTAAIFRQSAGYVFTICKSRTASHRNFVFTKTLNFETDLVFYKLGEYFSFYNAAIIFWKYYWKLQIN